MMLKEEEYGLRKNILFTEREQKEKMNKMRGFQNCSLNLVVHGT